MNKIYLLFDLVDVKCYCKGKEGRNYTKEYVCGKDENTSQTSHCAPDEKCIGPTKITDAVSANYKHLLCAKGG